MKKIILSFMILGTFLNAFAQEEAPLVNPANAVEGVHYVNLPPIVFPEKIVVRRGDTKIVPLNRMAFVDRMSLEIKKSPTCSDSSILVSYDGFNHQALRVRGGVMGFRTHIVNVGMNARTIEVRNTGNCRIKIKNIQVLPRRWMTGYWGGGAVIPRSEASGLVSFLLESTLFLDQMVSDQDRITYLSPAKKVFGNAMAVLNANPETSQAAAGALQRVLKHLDSMEPFIQRLATIESTFEISNEIQQVKSMLERMTR